MTLPDREFYRVKEICARLRISRTSLWKWVKDRRLPPLERKSARIAGYSKETLESVIKRISYLQEFPDLSYPGPTPRVVGEKTYVYFLAAGEFIKIGKCTGLPNSRIANLQTGCPMRITLIGYFEGDVQKEAELHARFAEYRVRPDGEWFRNEGKLANFVGAVQNLTEHEDELTN